MSLFVIFIMVFITSCKTQEKINNGIFRCTIKFPKDSGYITEQLILQSDSTFVLNTFGSSPHFATCKGRWKYISKDTIMIHCGGSEALDFFNPDIITYRPIRKIKVFSLYKIKMLQTYGTNDKYIVLKRVLTAYSEAKWRENRYGE